MPKEKKENVEEDSVEFKKSEKENIESKYRRKKCRMRKMSVVYVSQLFLPLLVVIKQIRSRYHNRLQSLLSIVVRCKHTLYNQYDDNGEHLIREGVSVGANMIGSSHTLIFFNLLFLPGCLFSCNRLNKVSFVFNIINSTEKFHFRRFPFDIFLIIFCRFCYFPFIHSAFRLFPFDICLFHQT